MKIDFIYTDYFKKNLKPLLKKYRSLPADLKKLESELKQNPYLGTKISENTYKIRLAIKSKGKGKSGGARVITHIREQEIEDLNLYFLAIYDKSDMSNIQDVAIQYIIEEVQEGQDEDETDSDEDTDIS